MKIAARIRIDMRATPVPIPDCAPLMRPLRCTDVGVEVPEVLILVGVAIEVVVGVVEVRVIVLSGTIGSIPSIWRSVAAQRT